MRLRLGLMLGAALLAAPTGAATPQAAFVDFARVCGASQALWGATSCGPLLIVDPDTRIAVANEADAGGVLRPWAGGLFAGTLPPDLVLANTALDFGGKRWAVVLLPLPDDPARRAVLLAHEAFHRIQPQLGLWDPSTEGRNGHLDREAGRLWLQLELRALDRALADLAFGRNPQEAVKDALLFRAERRRPLPPAAAADEAALERVEGSAEYTGVVAASPDIAARVVLARQNLARMPGLPSFPRAFAYATGPAYGLLLDRLAGDAWRARFRAGATFEALLAAAVGRSATGSAEQRAAAYDGPTLAAAERTRETARQKQEAELRAALVDGPVLVVPIAGPIGFDPTSVVVLDGAGTVYRGLKTSGPWGSLAAAGPALVAPDWSTVRVPGPVQVSDRKASGPGWTLTLNPGWRIATDARGRQTVLRAP